MAHHNADRDDDEHSGEIIALLQEVGQRLIKSEQDRMKLREMVIDLEEKADQGERAFLTVQDRISKTESIIEKRQKVMEKRQKEQMARIEKAAALADQMEEAMANYAKITRRLDKDAQEKARIVRKLERIEETVIETQDAVQANALILQKDALALARDANNDNDDAPWWKQHGPVRGAVLVFMVMIGACGGWIVSKVDLTSESARLAQFNPAPSDYQMAAAPQAHPEEPPTFDALDDYSGYGTPSEQERFAAAIDQAMAEAEPAVEAPVRNAAAPTPEAKPEPDTKLDPIEMDDEELLASLSEDPDKLASALNDIQTGAGQAAIPDEPAKIAPEKEQPKATPAAVQPQKKIEKQATREQTTKEFMAGQRDDRPLVDRIKADASLPAVIKEVEKKAFEGIPEAQHDLAAIYTAGHGGVDVNYERAATWFRESAVRGIANAQYNLGVLYHQGLGVKQNINTAVAWYRAAAEAGHPEAQYNLGIAYIEGIGTRYNPEKAAYYFEEAAKGGIMEAAYNLGLIHENGLTGKSQPDEALYWYKQAADMGSAEAKTAMDQLAKTLGLLPAEVDRLYGTKQQGGTAQPKTQKQSKAAAPSGIEYIEAQPLNATAYNDAPKEAAPQLPQIEENGNPNMAEDHAITAQIQEQLIRIGLYPGPADGSNDSLTEDAIRAYQAHHSLKQDGRPSQALLVHMMTSELGNNSGEYGSRAE
ncbi:MAG: SEL1-like repeat protein [Rhodospirillales bacterium]|nr:SEL1-like repeat protein [Rhodospirillales bacterium]MCB9996957.1 SEL1-like repeat protein [Rhodospirillales bacterium]